MYVHCVQRHAFHTWFIDGYSKDCLTCRSELISWDVTTPLLRKAVDQLRIKWDDNVVSVSQFQFTRYVVFKETVSVFAVYIDDRLLGKYRGKAP